MDSNGRLNAHEFALLRKALLTFDANKAEDNCPESLVWVPGYPGYPPCVSDADARALLESSLHLLRVPPSVVGVPPDRIGAKLMREGDDMATVRQRTNNGPGWRGQGSEKESCDKNKAVESLNEPRSRGPA